MSVYVMVLDKLIRGIARYSGQCRGYKVLCKILGGCGNWLIHVEVPVNKLGHTKLIQNFWFCLTSMHFAQCHVCESTVKGNRTLQ